ncbi:Tropomodulin-1 [Larimichthys crocea]|uniref:Uncharacterized protein n=1 Tax=Larimichthys crocea TaxID=215358 RepID=A0ACD3RTK9_LARCR|nr:Tropomodulin-1 [Larimichthys crocea]
MDAFPLHDITRVTGQPCWGAEEEEEEEEDLSLHKFTLPFAGDEIQPPLTRRETIRDGGGNFVTTLKTCRSFSLIQECSRLPLLLFYPCTGCHRGELSIMSVLRKEMEKYRDVDEDELLKKLSEEELQRLEDELEELDPDNALLPAGMRQKDQTKKAPTGTFQRDNLLAHLEKQAKEHPDKEDLVPFTGEKRGKAFVPKKRVDPS